MARLKDHLRTIRHNLPFLRSFYAVRRETVMLRQEIEALKLLTCPLETHRIETAMLRQEIEALKLMSCAIGGSRDAVRRLEKRIDIMESKIVDGLGHE